MEKTEREARLQRGNREVDVRAIILLVLCIIHISCSPPSLSTQGTSRSLGIRARWN